jgi:hypothetical protein
MRKFGAKNAAGLLRLAALDQQDESAAAPHGIAANSKRSNGTVPCKR